MIGPESTNVTALLSTPVDNNGDKLWGTPKRHVDNVVHILWVPSRVSPIFAC